jgi:hypothetical protein
MVPEEPVSSNLMRNGWPLAACAGLRHDVAPRKPIQTLEDLELLCRKNWLRPRKPLTVTPRDRYSKAYLQVPA